MPHPKVYGLTGLPMQDIKDLLSSIQDWTDLILGLKPGATHAEAIGSITVSDNPVFELSGFQLYTDPEQRSLQKRQLLADVLAATVMFWARDPEHDSERQAKFDHIAVYVATAIPLLGSQLGKAMWPNPGRELNKVLDLIAAAAANLEQVLSEPGSQYLREHEGLIRSVFSQLLPRLAGGHG